MNVEILAFGIAKDIVKGASFQLNLPAEATVGVLKQQLCSTYPDFERLASFAIAVNEAYRQDDFALNEKDEIVIIPPVSGG